jgi:hypothetical protein
MSTDGLDALRARVHEDEELARRLRQIDPARFVNEVTALAASLGIAVTRAELDAAIARGRQAWALRWIR